MLVLTRKQQEQILVGENIRITVVRVQGSTVRIGIEAPDDVRILRGEVQQKVQQQESDASAESQPNRPGLRQHVARRRPAIAGPLPDALRREVLATHAV
jgi:carbon storage regulator CsrA